VSLFLRAVRAERLKLRRSLTGWAILAGSLFTPAIMLAVRLHNGKDTSAMEASGTFWRQHWLESWESIAVLILPLLLILVVTLVTHLEHRHNTWKQLHATPVPLATIYAAKLLVLLLLVVEIFVVVHVGLLVAAALPLKWMVGRWMPRGPLLDGELLRWNARFFLDCLPVVGLQMALTLRSRNVLVPLGAGVLAWIVALVVMKSRYIAAVPHGYLAVDYLIVAGHRSASSLPAPPPLLALAAFALSVLAGFAAYARAADRGEAA
jgi:hypothetical protein